MPITVVKKADKISTGEDMARAGGTGLLEGFSGVFGGFGDIRELAETGAAAVQKKLGLPNIPLPKPAGSELTSKALSAIVRATGLDPRQARLVAAMVTPGGMANAPSTREVLGSVTNDKPLYQPQTKAGQRTRTAAQFAPAGLSPGGPARRLANVFVPAAASQGAGELTEGTPFEPYARLAGAMAGAGGVAMMGRGGPDTRMLAEASRSASDEQIAAARRLMQNAEAQGVRLTMAEALQQVTNSGTGMGRMLRVIEGTRAGNQRIAPVMAERPAQARAAITAAGDAIGGQTSQPSLIGPRAQSGAQGVLDRVRQQINEFARPHYEAAGGQGIPAEEFARLADDPAYARAMQEVLGDPVLGARLQNLPPNDLTVVDAVVKRLDRNVTASAQTAVNPGGDNQLAAQFGSARGMADDLATQVSPEWREARDIGAMGRRAVLEPLETGPVGKMAATDDVASQIGALYPPKPLAGGAAETATAVQALNNQAPGVAPALTRQHLLTTGMEATQENIGGPNQWGGAKWAAQVAGNPEQAQALASGYRLSGGDPQQFDALLEALRATGRRERPGSLTAYNARDIEELGKAGMTGEIARTGLNPPGVFRRIGQGFQDWQTERNAGRLADAILANPAEAERILLRAREVVPAGAELQTIERLALAAQLSRQPALEAP
jgi:hypothetical protein